MVTNSRADPALVEHAAPTVVYPALAGEMDALMRAKDWSATRLGPREAWPQSLRTALSIVMSSKFPMIIFWGPDLCVLYNDAYAPIFASKHPDVIGKTGFEAWGEIWDVIAPMFQAVMERGEATWSNDQHLALVRKGYKEECYFTWSYSPITDETGGVGGVFTAVTETTQRVLGERRLKTLRELGENVVTSKTAADACLKSARIVEKNPWDVPFALVYFVDERGQHARLAASAGVPHGHRAAAPFFALDADSVWSAKEVLRSGQSKVIDDVCAKVGPLPGGPWPEPTETAVVMPLASADATHPYGFIVVGSSPRRELDEEYRGFLSLLAGHVASAVSNASAHEAERKRAEALAEIDRAKTAFFSNVSHEFRTPLTLMLGPEEDALASANGALSGEHLRVVHRNTLRLLKLVNSLLEFSRIEAGRAEGCYEPTDLATLTSELASSFHSAIERGGVRLELDCPRLSEPVYVDHDMWEKIVLNLVSNAFKFTFQGTISVKLRKAGNAAELSVEDTGVGIPALELPRIFERFRRVEGMKARTHEGSGIGLALVRDLVALHGGDVNVESEEGKGTKFRVSIPLGTEHLPRERVGAARTLASTSVRAEAFVQEALRWVPASPEGSDGEASRDQPAPPQPVGMVHGARILVADDNADMRSYLTRLLRQHWLVEAVSDGVQALASARTRPPDLVLTDVMMPGLGGFGLLRELRADEHTAAIPVIMLSARAGEESSVEGLFAGADDYLVKPFSARELVARVATHLHLAKSRNELRRANEALAEAREFLENVLESSTEYSIIAKDLERRILAWNAGAARIYGYDAREVLGRSSDMLHVPEELESGFVAELHERALKQGHATGLFRRRRKDGTEFLSRVAITRRNDSRGEAIGYLIVSHDVTAEQRHVGEQQFLAQVGEALQESLDCAATVERIAQLAVGFVGDGCAIDVLDEEIEIRRMRVVFADPGRKALAEALEHIVPDRRHPLWDVITSRRPLLFPETTPDLLRLVANDEAHRRLLEAIGVRSAILLPMVARDRLIAVLTIVSCRSDRRYTDADLRLAQELARRASLALENARLYELSQEAIQGRDQIMGIVAHDLRNPLGTVLMQTTLLRRRGGEPERRSTKPVEVIERAATRMNRLIQDLLDVTRLKAGRLAIEPARVSARQVVSDAVDAQRALAASNLLELQLDVDPDLPEVRADRHRVLQVFENLIGNAIKFTEPGGRIVVHAARRGREVIFSVEDTGSGIAGEDLRYVFEQNWQAKGAERHGAGLGLPIVKGIVEAHAGRVWVESTRGEGSTFSFTIPVAA